MKAATFGPDAPPRLSDHREPVGSEYLQLVRVRAAALTTLDTLIAGGNHPFSPVGTAVVGREGVVESEHGERFFTPVTSIPMPYGSACERTVTDLSKALPVPAGVCDAVAAAIGNAGLAAWLPLSWRARLVPGETVVVLGATGTSGGMAVAAAAALGAGRVIAVGRNEARLEKLLSRGADAVVRLDETKDMADAYRQVAGGGVDVVLDYLCGSPVEQTLGAMSTGGRIVLIGTSAGAEMVVPAMVAKVRSLEVLGFAYHHAPIELQRAAYRELCAAWTRDAFHLDIASFDLDDFDAAWRLHLADGHARCVLLP